MNEILLTIDSDSFRLHAQEQEATVSEVAKLLQERAMFQIAETNFRPMAAALLQRREYAIRATLQDEYANQVADVEDDELLEQAA